MFKSHTASLLKLSCLLAMLAAGTASAKSLGDLALTMEGGPNPVAPYGALTYSLIVDNVGDAKARGLVLTNQLPRGVAFQSATRGCKFLNKRARKRLMLTCKASSLLPRQQIVWSVTVTASAQAGELRNTASVTSKKRDQNPANNTATLITTVVTAVASGSDSNPIPAPNPTPDPNPAPTPVPEPNPAPTPTPAPDPSASCPPLIQAAFSGGCTLYLSTPANCEKIDFSVGAYEFAWSTNGTFCEGPHKLQIGGNPPETWQQGNFVEYSISSGQWQEYGMTRNIGGYFYITPAILSQLNTNNGQYHWRVVGYYGSASESRTFSVK